MRGPFNRYPLLHQHKTSSRRASDVRKVPWAARRYTAPRSADEHHLAGRSGLKDLLVRARRLGERQFLANYGP